MNQRVVTGLLTAGCIALAGAGYMTYKNQDRTAPEIKVDQSEKIAYTEGEDYGKLLEGVRAQDDKDGDLTSEVFVEKVVPVSKKKAIVYYGVTDKANNVGTASREVTYQAAEDSDAAEETVQDTASEDTTQKTDEKSEKKTKKKSKKAKEKKAIKGTKKIQEAKQIKEVVVKDIKAKKKKKSSNNRPQGSEQPATPQPQEQQSKPQGNEKRAQGDERRPQRNNNNRKRPHNNKPKPQGDKPVRDDKPVQE